MNHPSWHQMWRSPALMLGFGFGSGLAPKAPGTFGTLLGALLFIPLLSVSQEAAWLVLALGLLSGAWICGRAAELVGVHDHGGIVWDEFVGIWLVLLLLPASYQAWYGWVAAFMLFRLFDIVKPWPIRWLDQRVHGGLGIMLDDIVAALFALIPIWVFYISLSN